MAKSNTVAYVVTDQSPLSYLGKTANPGDTVTDFPGESISWLLADGFIVSASASKVDAETSDN